jgi:hypothetical protein
MGGGSGAGFGVTGDHSRGFSFLILESGVWEFLLGVFDVLCKRSQFSMAFGAMVVVLWSSGGWLQRRSRACTKAAIKAPPCTLDMWGIWYGVVVPHRAGDPRVRDGPWEDSFPQPQIPSRVDLDSAVL